MQKDQGFTASMLGSSIHLDRASPLTTADYRGVPPCHIGRSINTASINNDDFKLSSLSSNTVQRSKNVLGLVKGRNDHRDFHKLTFPLSVQSSTHVSRLVGHRGAGQQHKGTPVQVRKEKCARLQQWRPLQECYNGRHRSVERR